MNLREVVFTNKGTKQIFLKNTLWLSLSEVIAKFLLFLITIAIIRYLGVTEYGKYSFAFAFTSLFTIFVDFGLNQLASREIAKGHSLSKKMIENILGMKLVLATFTILLIYVAIFFVHRNQNVEHLVHLAGIYAAIQGIVLFFPFIFAGYEKMEYNFIVRVGSNIFLLILVSCAIFLHLGSSGIILAYICNAVLFFVISITILTKRFFSFRIQFDFSFWRKITYQAWPLFATSACIIVLTNLDSTILGMFRSYKEVGIYQAAYKLLYVFQTINLIHFALFPRLSSLHQQKKHHESNMLIQQAVIVSIIVIITGLVIFTMFHEKIIHLVYGARYLGSGIPMVILMWGGAIGFFATLCSDILIVRTKQKKVLLTTLCGVVVNITLNLLLIPHYGANAAASAFLISQLVILLGNLIMLRN